MKLRLDIESLRAVMAVVESGSVTRAAERLNLTQSAVSHKLKRLEERIGRPVFRRRAAALDLTEDGVLLLSYAERLVSLHDEAAAQLSQDDLSGHLRLGITDDLTGIGIARILARFSAVYPKMSIESKVAHSLTLAQWLHGGALDLALMQLMGEEPLAGDRVLWWDQVVWAQSEDFQLADDRTLPFITFHERCFYWVWALEALRSSAYELRLVLTCPSLEGVTSAVRSGLGLTLIDRNNLRPGLIESPLPLPVPPRVVNVARAASRNPERTVLALLEAVEEALKDPFRVG